MGDTDGKSNSGGGVPPRWGRWFAPMAMGMILAGVAAFLYVLFAASSKPNTHAYAQFAVGEMHNLVVLDAPPPQPTQMLSDGAGGEVSLVDFRGEYALVNLWATWCAPCMEELPTLGDLQRRIQGRGIKVAPVNFDAQADLATARRQLDALGGGGLPFMADPSRKLMFDVEARGMPTTILYDREGRELARVTGMADWDSDEAMAFIEAALRE